MSNQGLNPAKPDPLHHSHGTLNPSAPLANRARTPSPGPSQHSHPAGSFFEKLDGIVDKVTTEVKKHLHTSEKLDRATREDELAGKAVFKTGVSAYADLAGVPGADGQGLANVEAEAKGARHPVGHQAHAPQPPAPHFQTHIHMPPVLSTSVSAFADRVAFMTPEDKQTVQREDQKWMHTDGKD